MNRKKIKLQLLSLDRKYLYYTKERLKQDHHFLNSHKSDKIQFNFLEGIKIYKNLKTFRI